MALRPSITAGLLVCGFLVACTAREPMENNMPDTSGDKGGVTRPSTPQSMDIDGQMTFAKNDLAERLQVDPADIQVVAAKMVQWRSGATGCPEPGMNYTMAIVPGVQILLKANGEVHHYHAGIGRVPFRCPAHQVEEPVQGSVDGALQET